jgi:nicotinamidase-related amidase
MFDLNSLSPRTTAVLSLDCQNGILELLPESARILPAAASVLAAARAKGFPVIHVGLGFRPGHPEVDPGHPTFGRILQSGKFVIGTDSAAFAGGLGAKPEELVVHKHRVSAFSGNDLEMILRSKGINHLVLFGIATSGIVLSTVREASDKDFRSLVIEDCCYDADEEVHRVLMTKVFLRQAGVVKADAFVKALA